MVVLVLVACCASGAAENVSTQTEVSRGAKPCKFENVQRPFVLLDAARLQAMRDRIKSDAHARKLYRDEIRSYADLWSTRSLAIPPRAGHYHDFVAPDGTRLEVPSDFQFKSHEYRNPTDGKLYSSAKIEGARRNYEHMWLVRACRSFAMVYAVEKNEEYGRRAAELLRNYADGYPGRHTSATAGGIFYQSLDESMNMILLAQAYDLVYDLLSPGDHQHIERDLFWEAAEGIANVGVHGNWGSWHLSAVGVIGLATRHQRFIDFGIDHFKAQMKDELGNDGLWPESVHTYHFFPLMAFVDFAEAATNAGIPLYQFEAPGHKGLHMMFKAPVQYMYPNLQLPAINDGWYWSYMPENLYWAAYARYHDSDFAWVVREWQRRKIGTVVDPNTARVNWELILDGDLPADPPRPDFKSVNFPVLGIAILRTPQSDMMMTFDYGPFLGHGHLDKMGVTLFAKDHVLAADYGTPSYGSAITAYYQSTFAHNTIVIDGKNQERTNKSRLVDFKPGGVNQLARALTEQAYPGTNWTRTVGVVDANHGTVSDDLISSRSRQYDWLMHCEAEDLQMSGVVDAETSIPALCPQYSDVKWLKPAGGKVEAKWVANGKSPLTASWSAAPEMLIGSGKCPAETGARRVPLLIIRQSGMRANYAVDLTTMR